MMKSGLFQRKLTRFTIKTSAASAPLVSALNSPFSNNSRASAAAVSELTQCLDLMFDQVNYKDEPGDLLQLHLSRLADQAAKYGNANLDESHGPEWTCSAQVSQLVHVACECSNLVYRPLEHQDSHLVRVLDTAPSLTGTKKAFSMWKMEALGALVVSVRGTACVADHMVNLNAQPAEASSTLGLPAGVLAHEGFLTCAKAIKTAVLQELAVQAKLDKTISNIIFTGHSAGGAVSSLLFLNLAFNLPVQMSHISLSLVTFGSAPVMSANISSLVKKLPSVGSVLAFVNEYDMVPRADTTYVRSLIDLYRSGYVMSPATDKTTLDADEPATKDTACNTDTREKGEVSLPMWPLPEPLFYPVGDIIISKSVLQHGATADAASDPTARPTRTYKMFHVPHETFDKLLFCGLAVHKRKVYLERTRSMLDQDSWSDTATLRTVGSQNSNTTR